MERTGSLRRWEVIAAAVLTALFIAQACLSARGKSLTTDEYPHFGAAVANVWKGRFDINANHPPFSKVITGLALLPLHPAVADLPDQVSKKITRWYGTQFLYENRADMGRIAFFGRLPHILLAALLGLIVWRASRRIAGGGAAAMCALFAFALDPNILAHARIVHTDTDATLFVFLSFYLLYRLLSGRPSWARSATFALALGLALSTKFSTVALFAFLPAFAAAQLVGMRKGWTSSPEGEDAGMMRGRLLRIGGRTLLMVCLIVPAVIAVLYRGDVASWFDGLSAVWAHDKRGHAGYFLGERSHGGHWGYFPVALAMKTPIPLLALAAAGLAAIGGRLKGGRSFDALLFTLPAALWLGAAVTTSLNIGIRHILQAYVFFFPLAAVGARALIRRSRGSRVLLVALLAWLAVGAVRTYPDYISYFNEAFRRGGVEGRYLVDSNLDWGQELITLEKWMKQNGVPEIVLHSVGAPAVNPYDIPEILPHEADPSPGNPVYLAMGATARSRIVGGRGDRYAESREFLRHAKRIETLGHSLYIYEITRPFPNPFPGPASPARGGTSSSGGGRAP